MLFVIHNGNFCVAEIEQVDTLECSVLEFELVMLHQWPILSKILCVCVCARVCVLIRFILLFTVERILLLWGNFDTDFSCISLFKGYYKIFGESIWKKAFYQLCHHMNLFYFYSAIENALRSKGNIFLN